MKLRIYFTEFDDKKYEEIKEALAGRIKGSLIEHRARLLREFRYLEVLEATEEDREAIEEIFSSMGVKAKVDEA